MSDKEMTPVTCLAELQPGDIIRHKCGSDAYVVTANYGGRVTAVRSQDVTCAGEWLVMRDRNDGEDDG